MAQKWYDLRQEHPELLLTHQSRDPKVQELAQWQNKQIIDYIKMVRRETGHEMYPHRFKQLRAWNFPFPIDIQTPKKTLKTFDDRLQEFVEWKEANNSPMVPQHTPILGEWGKFLHSPVSYLSSPDSCQTSPPRFLRSISFCSQGTTQRVPKEALWQEELHVR